MNRILDLVSDDPKAPISQTLIFIRDHEFSLVEEKDLVTFLLDFHSEHKCYPSRQLIASKLGIFVEKQDPLTVEELKYHWTSKFRERAKINASSILQEAANQALQGQDPKEAIQEALAILSTGSDSPVDETQVNQGSVMDLIASRRGKGGVTFGIEDLDNIVIDIESGTTTVIGAFVGNFKTTTALSMSYHNAVKGHSSAYLTLETPPAVLRTQLLSCHSFSPAWSHDPIPFVSILKDTLSIEDRDLLPKLERNFNELTGKIHCFGPGAVKGELISSLPKVAEYYADLGVEMFFLDHAQLFKYYAAAKDQINTVDRFVKTMTDVAVNLDARGYSFRTIFLSQINRDSYKKALRRGGLYDLSALAEYSELERSAAYIVTLFATDELKAINELKVQLLKQRLGATAEEPFSVFADAQYCVVGGNTAMSEFEATEETISSLLGSDFGF